MTWTTSYYHYDALGTTRELTDGAQAVSDRYVYDAYGNQRQAEGSTTNPFRYVGQLGYYYDSDTGAMNVRQRVYAPTLIHWLSLDPVGLTSNAPNQYSYVDNRPAGSVDPSGLATVNYVPGRGTFTRITLGSSAHPSRVFSDFVAHWIPSDFPPCVCDKIGFIQAALTAADYSGLYGLLIEALINRTWHPDKSVPYPYPDPASRLGTTSPIPGPGISMRDTPYLQISVGPSTLRHGTQKFEACVVCLEGKEGIKQDRVLYRNIISEVTVYGCVRWSHDIGESFPIGTYAVMRILDNLHPHIETHKGNTSQTFLRLNGYTGDPPSARFQAAMNVPY